MAAPIELAIESVDHEARGVAHHDGKVIFVDGALPGELVHGASYRKKPKFENAQITAILQASASRVTPRCPNYGTCGGCSMQHGDLATQVAIKQRVLEDNLKFQKMRGKLNEDGYNREVALVRSTLTAMTEPHWREYLAAWPA